jgi:Flp pilus assembly protein TadG
MTTPAFCPRLFGRSRRGTTAVEFAILAVPFWLFVLFIFELGLDFYVQLALDYAVQQGARRLQTGAVSAAASVAAFKTDCFCPPVAAFLNCNQITVTAYALGTNDYYLNAQGGGGFVPTTGGALNTSSWTFSPGAPSGAMFLQAVYTSVSVVGQLLPGLSMTSGSNQVHVTTSSAGFVNESYPTLTTICGASS